jgi:hypothetical protein
MINSFSDRDILAEQAEFATDLAAAESLPVELTAFDIAVGELAYGVPPVPLPRGLKSRLFSDVGTSDVDRLIEVNYPKPPRLNRPIKGNVRDVTVRGKPR